MTKHTVAPEHAAKFAEWIRSRGGVAIWRTLDASDAGLSWSSPALTVDGQPMGKPSWKAETAPSRIITDPAEIDVIVPKEVKRFYVAVRMGAQGFKLKVTDGGTRKINAAVAKAGDGAWYEFDYSTQEAVIYVPGSTVPLSDWKDPA